ncbi:hypothetical protein [Catenuloplanes atrovinosus]|uniref:Uncharacterized protein n=1 Tax=Catenuloplanes atrovinosus TaxID=137266 RepID=A0AAE3YT57_9ACTN|nr:hypothetical protein [Catenuloplanes atrovinosus]MDR7279185.1 hypothetical protein [Catenuloplanes atrovinosus]
MSDVRVEVARAGRAAHDLADAGAELLGRARAAGTRIQALSAAPPWGADEIGAAFEARYRAVEARVLAATEDLGAQVEDLGVSATVAVRRVTATDDANDALIQGAWPV